MHRSLTASRLRGSVATTLTALALLAGCSSGSGGSTGSAGSSPGAVATPTVDAATAQLLAKARQRLDAARAVQFSMTSSNVPGGGTRLLGGSGAMTRPTPSSGAFRGAVSVLLNDNKVTVDLVSVDNKVYVKLPFSAKYQVADPAGFGLSDPAKLIDEKTGISQLFDQLQEIKALGRKRVGPEVVQQVGGTVPGTVVQRLLTSADPSQPVDAVLSIVPGSGQLRQAELTGPFFVKGTDSTYTVTLDRYDRKVTIKAPSVA